MHSTDVELAHRAGEGDEAAGTELVERYAPPLYRLAFALVGNAADAEDVVQETFFGAFRRLSSFEGRASLKTWLSRILVRQAARHHRTRARHRTVSFERSGEPTAAPQRRSQTVADRDDLKLDLPSVLQGLSPVHREVIVLRELQGLAYDEIADVLDVPRGTVESRLFRARRALRERLRDYRPGAG